MGKKARIGGGAVDIELDGKPFKLVPSLEACIEISGMAGGLRAAAERCMALHFATVMEVIGAGLDADGRGQRLNPRQRQDMLPKAIYEAGIVRCSGWAIDFINIVGNGGRAIGDEPEGGDGDDAGDPLPSENTTS